MEYARSAQLPPGGLRLHYLHRQQRSAARGCDGGSPEGQPDRGRGAQRQSQFRRPHQSAGESQLPRIAAAGGGLRAGRHDGYRHGQRFAGAGSDGQPVYLRDIWPTNEEVAATVRSAVTAGMFEHEYAHAFDGDKNWQSLQVPTGEIYQWDDASTYIKKPPYFENMADPDRSDPGSAPDAGAGAVGRFGDHRPHFAGGFDSQGQPGRPVPDRAGRTAGRLQLLRGAARQSRGDGARHAGQHTPAQSTGAGHRRRRDAPPAGWRADVDLRRLDEVSA